MDEYGHVFLRWRREYAPQGVDIALVMAAPGNFPASYDPKSVCFGHDLLVKNMLNHHRKVLPAIVIAGGNMTRPEIRACGMMEGNDVGRALETAAYLQRQGSIIKQTAARVAAQRKPRHGARGFGGETVETTCLAAGTLRLTA
ncbi:hypothetical protein HYH03_012048 [Edaphochlamys debaryana]|nr:hypothetical protein HYH03_012048 [Edaphochlamys debaryana]|eukprot:KAG2489409.1 hypothetical protein HYH03_012048 [Edaphochlamys debaryana]